MLAALSGKRACSSGPRTDGGATAANDSSAAWKAAPVMSIAHACCGVRPSRVELELRDCMPRVHERRRVGHVDCRKGGAIKQDHNVCRGVSKDQPTSWRARQSLRKVLGDPLHLHVDGEFRPNQQVMAAWVRSLGWTGPALKGQTGVRLVLALELVSCIRVPSASVY